MTVAGSVMSIRDYFRPSSGLPEPMGSLSLHIPSQAITLTNKEVEEVIKEGTRVDKTNIQQLRLFVDTVLFLFFS